MSRVLVVDDEPGVRFAVREALASAGHEVREAKSGAEALATLDGIDAVVTDLVMPGVSGLEVVARAREIDPDLPVILLTARGSERVAVEAIRAGAFDYLGKPFELEALELAVARAVEACALRRAARARRRADHVGVEIVAESAAMRAVIAQASRLAGRDVPVLVRGETGTGKELVAALLHAESPRSARPLVRFNCAALSPALAESELFGHARGAFTGAVASHDGFFARADGGTLVLDEIGELPLALQPKLLRAIQEGEVQRVGAPSTIEVDARVVACTNRDLLAEAAAGRFREDLYYRVAVVEIVVPPLRERREDVAPLARAFVARAAARFGVDPPPLSPALVAELAARPWPGNVRELENTVTRMVALSDGRDLDVGALGDGAQAPAEAGLAAQVAAFERSLVARALADSGGNRSEAARRLGLSRVTLIDKLKRHGLV